MWWQVGTRERGTVGREKGTLAEMAGVTGMDNDWMMQLWGSTLPWSFDHLPGSPRLWCVRLAWNWHQDSWVSLREGKGRGAQRGQRNCIDVSGKSYVHERKRQKDGIVLEKGTPNQHQCMDLHFPARNFWTQGRHSKLEAWMMTAILHIPPKFHPYWGTQATILYTGSGLASQSVIWCIWWTCLTQSPTCSRFTKCVYVLPSLRSPSTAP